MNQKVDAKLQELNQKKNEQYFKKKETDLETWGLVAKKGEPPIIVSDEEYEALVKASNGLASRNGVSVLLNIVSITVLVFSIIGALLANIFLENATMFTSVIIVICGIVFTTILGGLAEAIKLLQQLIDDKPLEIPAKQPKGANATQPQQPPQPPVMYQQQAVYPPQTVYQPQAAYQQPPVYQPQPPVYQPPAYQQSPSYATPVYEADDIFKANAPVQFDE